MSRSLLPHTRIAVGLFALLLAGIAPTLAQDAPLLEAPAGTQPTPPLTVAVLDFQVDNPAQPALGAQIAEALTAMLAGEPGFSLVERTSLQKALDEQHLTLTGLVDPQQAVQVGRLVGARILITGKLFRLGERLFLTVKLIGTETTLVDGMLLKAGADAPLDELVLDLGLQLPDRLRKAGPRLVAAEPLVDPLAAVIARLAGRELPTVAVVVVEEHHASRPAPPPIDPAVETELKRLLLQAGVTLKDVPHNELAGWAHRAGEGGTEPWPRSLSGVDLVITGEAFSAYAGRIGELISCSARAEINVIDRRSGAIVLADRATTRGVDLAEPLAGKKALQKAGRALALAVLEHLARTAPPAAPADSPAPPPEQTPSEPTP